MLTDYCSPYSRNRSRRDWWFNETNRWALSVSTAPAVEPVTVRDVKDDARIDTYDDDVWIWNAIKAARELCETFLKRCFITTTLRLNLDEFPTEFVLPRPNLLTVTSIKYLDTSGVQQTVSASDYSVDIRSVPGRIVTAYNVSWPTYRQFANSIEVIYTAGYGAAATAVPAAIKQAIKLTVSDWYDDCDCEGTIPKAAQALLRSESWGFVP